jgi:hypothetical protein
MVRDVTDAVLRADGGAHPSDSNRVWVFPTEVPDGTWGGGGRINTLGDIVGYVVDDPEKGHAYAERRLAKRRAAAVAG